MVRRFILVYVGIAALFAAAAYIGVRLGQPEARVPAAPAEPSEPVGELVPSDARLLDELVVVIRTAPAWMSS